MARKIIVISWSSFVSTIGRTSIVVVYISAVEGITKTKNDKHVLDIIDCSWHLQPCG